MYLICHVTTRLNDRVKNWVRAKFGSYRSYGRGDNTFSNCHMISPGNAIRESYDFKGGLPLQ